MSRHLQALPAACLVIVLGIVASGLFFSLPVAAGTTAQTVSINPVAFKDCKGSFFGLIPWYEYMEKEFDPATCNVECFNLFNQTTPNECGQTRSDVPAILLAIIDDLLRIAGLVAVAFVFVASFQFIESRGNSEKAAKAQDTIKNAIVGLVVALVGVGFISFLGSQL